MELRQLIRRTMLDSLSPAATAVVESVVDAVVQNLDPSGAGSESELPTEEALKDQDGFDRLINVRCNIWSGVFWNT